MSLERSGAPVAVWEPATTQLLEPSRQPLHWWARRSAKMRRRSAGLACAARTASVGFGGGSRVRGGVLAACEPMSEVPDMGHPVVSLVGEGRSSARSFRDETAVGMGHPCAARTASVGFGGGSRVRGGVLAACEPMSEVPDMGHPVVSLVGEGRSPARSFRDETAVGMGHPGAARMASVGFGGARECVGGCWQPANPCLKFQTWGTRLCRWSAKGDRPHAHAAMGLR